MAMCQGRVPLLLALLVASAYAGVEITDIECSSGSANLTNKSLQEVCGGPLIAVLSNTGTSAAANVSYQLKVVLSTMGPFLLPSELQVLPLMSKTLTGADLPSSARGAVRINITGTVPSVANCGTAYIVIAVIAGTAVSQDAVPGAVPCTGEDVDLKWTLPANASKASITVTPGQNITSGLTLSLSNAGKTALKQRMAMDAVEVKVILAHEGTLPFFLTEQAGNMTVKEMSDNILMNLDHLLLNDAPEAFLLMSPINGAETLLLADDLQSGRALAAGSALYLALSSLRVPQDAPSIGSGLPGALILVLDPFNKTADSNRTNNVIALLVNFTASAPLDADRGGLFPGSSWMESCRVVPSVEDDGQSALIVSLQSMPYMYDGDKGGFRKANSSETKTAIMRSMESRQATARLKAMGRCTEDLFKAAGDDPAASMADSQLGKMRRLVNAASAGVAALTPKLKTDVARSSNNKTKILLEAAQQLLSNALDGDDKAKAFILQMLTFKLKSHLMGPVMYGASGDPFGGNSDDPFMPDYMPPSGSWGGYGQGINFPRPPAYPSDGGASAGLGGSIGFGAFPPMGAAVPFGSSGSSVFSASAGGSRPTSSSVSAMASGSVTNALPGAVNSGLPASRSGAGSGRPTTAATWGERPDGTFRCRNGDVTSTRYAACDGYPDCADSSDEQNCGFGASALNKGDKDGRDSVGLEESKKGGPRQLNGTKDNSTGKHRLTENVPTPAESIADVLADLLTGGASPKKRKLQVANAIHAAWDKNGTLPEEILALVDAQKLDALLKTRKDMKPNNKTSASRNSRVQINFRGGSYDDEGDDGDRYGGGSHDDGEWSHEDGDDGESYGGGSYGGPRRRGGRFGGGGGDHHSRGNHGGGDGGRHRGGDRGDGSGRGWRQRGGPGSREGSCDAMSREAREMEEVASKLLMRLMVSAPEDMKEFSFLPLSLRRALKAVISEVMIPEEPPQVCLPWRTAAENSTVLQFLPVVLMQMAGYMSVPTTETMKQAMEFLKVNVSQEVRAYHAGNANMLALLDLSLLYMDIAEQNLPLIVDLMAPTMNPEDREEMMESVRGKPGMEPSLEDRCARLGRATVSAAYSANDQTVQSSPKSAIFASPMEMLAEVDDEDESWDPVYWRVESKDVLRGTRSSLTGAMMWDKVAVCSCSGSSAFPDHTHGRPFGPSAPDMGGRPFGSGRRDGQEGHFGSGRPNMQAGAFGSGGPNMQGGAFGPGRPNMQVEPFGSGGLNQQGGPFGSVGSIMTVLSRNVNGSVMPQPPSLFPPKTVSGSVMPKPASLFPPKYVNGSVMPQPASPFFPSNINNSVIAQLASLFSPSNVNGSVMAQLASLFPPSNVNGSVMGQLASIFPPSNVNGSVMAQLASFFPSSNVNGSVMAQLASLFPSSNVNGSVMTQLGSLFPPRNVNGSVMAQLASLFPPSNVNGSVMAQLASLFLPLNVNGSVKPQNAPSGNVNGSVIPPPALPKNVNGTVIPPPALPRNVNGSVIPPPALPRNVNGSVMAQPFPPVFPRNVNGSVMPLPPLFNSSGGAQPPLFNRASDYQPPLMQFPTNFGGAAAGGSHQVNVSAIANQVRSLITNPDGSLNQDAINNLLKNVTASGFNLGGGAGGFNLGQFLTRPSHSGSGETVHLNSIGTQQDNSATDWAQIAMTSHLELVQRAEEVLEGNRLQVSGKVLVVRQRTDSKKIEFGTICDDGWGEEEARVVCGVVANRLQLPLIRASPSATFAPTAQGPAGVIDNASVKLDGVECQGDEQDILQCKHDGWGVHNCADHEAAFVTCLMQ